VSQSYQRVSQRVIRAMPKAEVHIHLEGAIELSDLLTLAAETGSPLPGPAATLFDIGTHVQPAAPSELSAYLRFLDWEGSLHHTHEQVVRTAYRFAARQSASGILYTDVIVNPTHWGDWNARLLDLLAALREGFDAAEADRLCAVNVCVSLDRGQSQSEAVALATLLVTRRPGRVVALSVDGDERVSGRTGAKFAEAFDIARRGDLHRTVHAGESSGPEGIWDAITLLHADRIDHGVEAVSDERLMDHLAQSGIPVGVCPTSNLTLGLAEDIDSHPVRHLLDRGVTVTINTDDPAPLGTRLEAEWWMCADAFGWDFSRVTDLARTSFAASYADESQRVALDSALDGFIARERGVAQVQVVPRDQDVTAAETAVPA
jgi:adenosine deaminase